MLLNIVENVDPLTDIFTVVIFFFFWWGGVVFFSHQKENSLYNRENVDQPIMVPYLWKNYFFQTYHTTTFIIRRS